jgi:hypothetical protein
MLKYDTLYQSLKKVSADWHAGNLSWGYSWYYLKFYIDGTVIQTYTNGEDPSEINKWFQPNSQNIDQGTFHIEDNRLTLTFRDHKLDGAIVSETMILLKGSHNWEEYRLLL